LQFNVSAKFADALRPHSGWRLGRNAVTDFHVMAGTNDELAHPVAKKIACSEFASHVYFGIVPEASSGVEAPGSVKQP
jgi:hypothetical protein